MCLHPIAKLSALMLSALVCVGAALPPEHSHPANQDHGGIVHRHWSAHVAHHSAHPTLDEDDGRIVWIDAGFISAQRTMQMPPVLLPAAEIADCSTARETEWVLTNGESVRTHAPPIARESPRPPPSSPLV
jgi:hypothetical protein